MRQSDIDLTGKLENNGVLCYSNEKWDRQENQQCHWIISISRK